MMRKNLFVVLLFLVIFILTGCKSKAPEAVVAESSIPWMYDVQAALDSAKAQNKPVMIEFSAVWCPPCKQLKAETLCDSLVIQKLTQFIPVTIDVDSQTTVANAYNGNARKYGGVGIPNMLFLDPAGKEIKHVIGFKSAEQFVATLDSVLAESPKAE